MTIRRLLLSRAAAALAIAATSACSAGSHVSRPQGAMAAVADDAGLVRPGSVHLGGSSVEDAAPVVLRAQQLYSFWDTGDERWLAKAVDDSFRDRTLPQGRPQGPPGLIAASRQFRTAVPDLACELDDLYVTGDTFTARLTFTGHFDGTSSGVQGDGQQIRFGAIDIQHVGDSRRIVEDWHLEDNLTFMQQAGLLPGS